MTATAPLWPSTAELLERQQQQQQQSKPTSGEQTKTTSSTSSLSTCRYTFDGRSAKGHQQHQQPNPPAPPVPLQARPPPATVVVMPYHVPTPPPHPATHLSKEEEEESTLSMSTRKENGVGGRGRGGSGRPPLILPTAATKTDITCQDQQQAPMNPPQQQGREYQLPLPVAPLGEVELSLPPSALQQQQQHQPQHPHQQPSSAVVHVPTAAAAAAVAADAETVLFQPTARFLHDWYTSLSSLSNSANNNESLLPAAEDKNVASSEQIVLTLTSVLVERGWTPEIWPNLYRPGCWGWGLALVVPSAALMMSGAQQRRSLPFASRRHPTPTTVSSFSFGSTFGAATPPPTPYSSAASTPRTVPGNAGTATAGGVSTQGLLSLPSSLTSTPTPMMYPSPLFDAPPPQQPVSVSTNTATCTSTTAIAMMTSLSTDVDDNCCTPQPCLTGPSAVPSTVPPLIPPHQHQHGHRLHAAVPSSTTSSVSSVSRQVEEEEGGVLNSSTTSTLEVPLASLDESLDGSTSASTPAPTPTNCSFVTPTKGTTPCSGVRGAITTTPPPLAPVSSPLSSKHKILEASEAATVTLVSTYISEDKLKKLQTVLSQVIAMTPRLNALCSMTGLGLEDSSSSSSSPSGNGNVHNDANASGSSATQEKDLKGNPACRYRGLVLRDCIHHTAIVMYVETVRQMVVEKKRQHTAGAAVASVTGGSPPPSPAGGVAGGVGRVSPSPFTRDGLEHVEPNDGSQLSSYPPICLMAVAVVAAAKFWHQEAFLTHSDLTQFRVIRKLTRHGHSVLRYFTATAMVSLELQMVAAATHLATPTIAEMAHTLLLEYSTSTCTLSASASASGIHSTICGAPSPSGLTSRSKIEAEVQMAHKLSALLGEVAVSPEMLLLFYPTVPPQCPSGTATPQAGGGGGLGVATAGGRLSTCGGGSAEGPIDDMPMDPLALGLPPPPSSDVLPVEGATTTPPPSSPASSSLVATPATQWWSSPPTTPGCPPIAEHSRGAQGLNPFSFSSPPQPHQQQQQHHLHFAPPPTPASTPQPQQLPPHQAWQHQHSMASTATALVHHTILTSTPL